jgi:hypothetical protein
MMAIRRLSITTMRKSVARMKKNQVRPRYSWLKEEVSKSPRSS